MKMDLWAEDQTMAHFTAPNILGNKELLMSIPGVTYRARHDAFVAPLTWSLVQTSRGVFGQALEVGEDVATWAWEEFENRVRPALELRLADHAEGDPQLYPFQRAGVKFLTTARKALLGDEMGSGKTVQTAVALRTIWSSGEPVFPAVVVAPNNMVLTWVKELAKWFPEAKTIAISGSAAQRAKQFASGADIFVLNWEKVRYHSRLAPYGTIRLKRCHVCEPNLPETAKQSACEHCQKELNQLGIKSLVIDEAHKLKDPKSKQTRAVHALHEAGTETVFALTGTPIASAPDDFWSILRAIHPGEWPSRSRYIDRYCQTTYNIWSGGLTVTGLNPATQEEFFRIVDPRMRRMPKAVVLPQLPPKTYQVRTVEMTPKQTSAYKMMADQMIAMLEDAAVVALNPLTQMTRLVQFASSHAEVDETGEVKLSAPSSKVEGLVELLEEMVEEPAVVFAESRQLIDIAAERLEKEGITFSKIVGGQSPDERERAKDDFQAGRVRVILCTIKAGGVGITLTRANTCIFLQRSWSLIDNKQAEDRVHRIGSEVHDKVQIIDLVSAGTIEEHQADLLNGKAERLEEIVRDKQAMAALLGKEKKK